MPTPEETKKFFAELFDRIAPTYDAVEADFFTPFANRLVELARLEPGWSVLDVGTGRGAVLRQASRAVGPAGIAHGIDISPAMVALTEAELRDEGLRNVVVEVGDAEAPPEQPDGWDAVTAGLVVFFLPDTDAALQAWRRRLRPGGVLALSTFASEDERWLPVFDAFRPHLPPHVAPSQLPPAGWHREDDGVARTLASSGYGSITSTTEVFTTRFRDVEHWIEFSYSNGMRIYWESVDDATREVMLADVTAALDELRADDGTLTLRTGVRFTTARA